MTSNQTPEREPGETQCGYWAEGETHTEGGRIRLGLCGKHYSRFRRYGHPSIVFQRGRRPGPKWHEVEPD